MFDTQTIHQLDPALAEAMENERLRQESHIELIASENFTSPRVMAAQGSVLTNKYAEGYPGARYYDGCRYVDIVESLAIDRACKLFGATFANVQPHSGSQANQAVFHAVLKPGDCILGMSIADGGHLTHGAKVNLSGKLFNAHGYGLHPETNDLNYEEAEQLAREHKPKLIIAGASAFSRQIDFARFRKIADEVGALLMADVAHYAGLIAAGVYPNPFPHAHFVTTTTHKTLRGPRGGLVMWNDEQFSKKINGALFPALQGGPLMHVIAGKAMAFCEAMSPEFKKYQQQTLDNARTVAGRLMEGGLHIISGGTDSHLMLVDLRPAGVTGRDAATALDAAHITLNKNGVPGDTQPPAITSGIRIGLPAATTRGFGESECLQTSNWILRVIDDKGDEKTVAAVAEEVQELCARFPIYAQ